MRRSDPTIFPVLGIALTSKSLDQEALRQLAEFTVRPALTAVEGVAGVDVLGGAPREFAVEVDPARAQAVGVSLPDIATALAQANTVRGVGRIEDRHRLYLVLAQNRLATQSDLAATPVGSASAGGVGLVTLGQIAHDPTLHRAVLHAGHLQRSACGAGQHPPDARRRHGGHRPRRGRAAEGGGPAADGDRHPPFTTSRSW